jgi:iron complex outermembrane receptor protein
MKSKNKFVFAALALPSMIQPLIALAVDKQAQEETTVLDTIVITGKKAAQSGLNKTELNAEGITRRQAQVQDTAKLLEDIPGVSLQAGGGVSSLPIIHGLNDERVKIDVNGMNIVSACANHMNPALSYIDRSNIGQITVLRGITPVSMGGDSIGGTISVQSAEPVFAKPGQDILLNGSLSGFYRNNGNSFGGSMALGLANKNVRLDYTGSHSQSGNYSDARGIAVKSSAYTSQNHAFNLAFKFDNHLLEFKGGQQYIPFQGFPTQRMDMTNNDSIFGNVHYKGTFDWGNLDGRVYLENTSHTMDIMDDKFYTNNANRALTMKMPMEVRGRNVGYKIQAELPVNEDHLVRIGNEFHSNRLNEWWPAVKGSMGMAPNDFVNLNGATRDRVGTFAEWEANWTPELKSMLGFRYDHTMTDTGNVGAYQTTGTTVTAANAFNRLNHARSFDTFDVTALLQFKPNKMSQFEFGYARKNRAPSLYELYPWSTAGMMMTMIGSAGDGNGYTGNLNLKPEVAHNLSLTAAFRDPTNNAWDAKVTPYFSYVENFIDADRCTTCVQPTNGFYYLKYANHNARLWGIDVNGRADLYKDDNAGQFTARTAMSYVRGQRMDGGNLYHMMPFNLKVGVDHKLGGWKSGLEMQFVTAKTDVQAIRNELRTPGYILLNAKTGYQWKNLSVDVGLDNLLNKQYYHPLGGAYMGDYYAMSLGGAEKGNTRNLPGMGRAVFVGMTLSY